MSLWTLEPRDPLVVRDGRPNRGRSESATLAFPFPGTIAGMVRTRLGSDERGVFDPTQDLAALRAVGIRGPLLARLDETGRHALYARAPRDALVAGPVLRRLAPRPLPAGALCDDAFAGEPVGLSSVTAEATGKPAGSPAAWWPWELLERWLSAPAAMEGLDAEALLAGALPPLPVEARAHVKLGETGTAEDEMLFQVHGLRFATEAREPLALAVDVAPSASGRALRTGIGPSGGERRLVRWAPAPALSLPALAAGVRAALAADAPSVRVRVVLLTPALFAAGWRPGAAPGQLLGPRHGVTPRLAAACVPRAETISGWDFEKRQPKETRRLVRAGSVYWLDLAGAPDDRGRWAEEVMMSNVSDAEQDRRDGFGLAVVGVGS
jgi:CRISPR-associated protein Cmr3